MKLAKQIIKLSAIAIAAMGLSFILISGIIIGIETGTLPERKSLNITYTEQTRLLDEIHDKLIDAKKDALATANAKVVEGGYTQAQKDIDVKTAQTALTTAEKNKADAIRTLDNANGQNLLTIKKGGKLQTATVNATTGAVTLTAASVDTLGSRDRIAAAFTEASGTFSMDGGVTTSTFDIQLTPMGALMVAGLVFSFVGGALVVTLVIMKKKEGEGSTSSKK